MAKSKYSNDLKQLTLLDGTFGRVKDRKKTIYQLRKAGYETLATLEEFSMRQDRKDSQHYDCAVCLADSTKQRKKRYNKKVSDFFDYGIVVYFLTLTFSDEVLKATSKETRRTYVRKFLRENADTYLANIDYGDKGGREHYHAITDKLPSKWPYGFYLFKPVRYDAEDYLKVGNYVAKLTNHALKKTTEMNRVIYSRKKRN